MSNSIWKTGDQKPERFRTVIFQSIEWEEPELGHWDGQIICPHNEFESLDMSQITRWCYLDDLIAQADKAERLEAENEAMREEFEVWHGNHKCVLEDNERLQKAVDLALDAFGVMQKTMLETGNYIQSSWIENTAFVIKQMIKGNRWAIK